MMTPSGAGETTGIMNNYLFLYCVGLSYGYLDEINRSDTFVLWTWQCMMRQTWIAKVGYPRISRN